MECPTCRSREFFLRDPEDEYETLDFDCVEGEIHFEEGTDPGETPEITSGTVTYCRKCAWHGRFAELEKKR